jgi:pimeloyl-ACP methyl ester carboxylesterase
LIAKPENARRLSVALSDGDVSVLVWAQDRPGAKGAIHFAHANGFNAQTYSGMLGALARDHTVFASDLRGHGLTTLRADATKAKGWGQYVHDIAATLMQLPGAPFVLGGHSMGATASLLVAAENPHLVRGLVLAEPVVMPLRLRLMAHAAKALGFYDRIMPMAAQAKRRRMHWPSIEAAFGAYRGRGAFKAWPDETLLDYLTGGLVPDPHGGGLMLACAPEWEASNYESGPPSITSALSKLQAPVVLLTGGHRSTCPPPIARDLTRRAKNMKWLYFPECSHFLPMERADAVADSLHAMGE